MAKKPAPRTADEVLIEVCEYQYRHSEGRSFYKSDVLPVSDLIRAGLVEFRDVDEYGDTLFPTDAGLLRFHEMKVAEYRRKLMAPTVEIIA